MSAPGSSSAAAPRARAVVVCTGGAGFPDALRAHTPAALLPLADRPFVQHVVEHLAARGILDLDLVVGEHPEAIEALIGDGARWGCHVRYRLERAPQARDRYVRLVAAEHPDQPLWLVHADRLAALPDALPDAGDDPLLLVDAESHAWTGWAWLPRWAGAVVPDDADEPGLLAFLRALPGAREVNARDALAGDDVPGLLAANRRLLMAAHVGSPLTGREVEPGVWLSRNVVLHPTARLIPPVHLGEDVRVGAGGRVGPLAVIGRGSVLDEHVQVRRAVVAPGTYVGEDLDLTDALVTHNVLASATHGGATTVTDRFILGALRDAPQAAPLYRATVRLAASVALLLGLPLLLLAWLARLLGGRRPVWHHLDALRLPAEVDEGTWRTVRLRALAPLSPPPGAPSWSDALLRVLPLLGAVARGQLWLVGVPPRTPDEVRGLPENWRALYLLARAGVISEAQVIGAQGEDEIHAAESVQAVTRSFRRDVALAWRYLLQVLGAGGDRP